MLKVKDSKILQKLIKRYDLEFKKDIITNKDRYYCIYALEIDTWNDNCIRPYNAHFSTYDLDMIYLWTKEGLLSYVED